MLANHLNSINIFDNVDKMFVTTVLVVSITSLLYRLMGRFDKPMVLGGLLAGVIIANLHLPQAYFDLDSCAHLGDVGLVLFMMLLGAQFDYKIVLEKKSNTLISLGSIILPFCCGLFIAKYLYFYNKGSDTAVPFFQFSIIIGLSISISAFSLISMFLSHTNLVHKKISQITLLAAATDDIFFWVIFGAIIIHFQTNNIIMINESIIFVTYIILLIFVFPRLVRYIANRINSAQQMLGFIVCGCFLSAILADSVDLHQVFGGFIFGLMLPRDNPHVLLIRNRLEDFVNVILLPIFFAKIGAMANINIITNQKIILIGLILALIAFSTKFIGAYVSSRLLHISKYESAFLASLLNIRGVVEIVMIKVAWEIGLINLNILTIFIIVAMVTTWVATWLAICFKRFLN